jgi:hypothetical protein
VARSRQTPPSEPDDLPEIDRRLRFGGWQMAGLGLIMLIPVLAAFEVFGEGSATVVHSGSALAISAEYPARIRHGTPEEVTVLATNRSPSPLDTVTVRFDSSYVARFTDPQFVPSISDAYEVELADVGPGETRAIRLGIRANEYGRHRGSIAAFHGADTARVTISTIVFP